MGPHFKNPSNEWRGIKGLWAIPTLTWKTTLPSASESLTAGFGMGPGVSSPSVVTQSYICHNFRFFQRCIGIVSSLFFFSFFRSFLRSRPRAISIAQLNASQRLHLRPINVLVSNCPYSLRRDTSSRSMFRA